MKTYNHQGAFPDSLHGRAGDFYVAGVRVCCGVVSIAASVLPCDTCSLPPASVAFSYSSVIPGILHHNKTAAVPYALLLTIDRRIPIMQGRNIAFKGGYEQLVHGHAGIVDRVRDTVSLATCFH